MKRKGRKRFFIWMLILCMLCNLGTGLQMRAEAAGDSESLDLSGEIIEIDSVEDFLTICDPANYAAINVTGKKIVLAADINMEGQGEIEPIGGSTAFNGVFDGQNHVIKNLSILSTGNCTGLFGHVGTDGQIMNLGLDRVKVAGNINTGAFAGVLTGSVTECYVTGYITGMRYTGSIAGMLHAGTIENCWTDTELAGSYCCGGLFGGSDWDTEYNGNPPTPLTGPITDKSMVVRNNLTFGTVIANRNTAGILGYMGDSKASPLEAFEGNVAWTESITVRANDAYDYYDPVYAWWSVYRANPTIQYNNLYWDGMSLNGADQSATLTSGRCVTHDKLSVVSATEEQLLTESTYDEDLNWDFETIWTWSDKLNHPVLQGFAEPEDYVPGEQKTPASVVTTYVDSPKTSRAFTWYTDTSIVKTVIQAVSQENFTGEEDFAGENALRAEGTYYSLETAADGTSRNIHKVNLTGLMAGTTYCYRVGDDTNWSPVYTFTTEPEESDSFTFFSITDTQEAYKRYANTLKYATENYPDGAFILHSGDAIQYNGTADYDSLYSLTSKYTTNLPTMITPGNHELDKDTISTPDYVKGLDNYKSHYQLPDNGPENGKQIIYSFEYGDAHFMILNSNNEKDNITTNGYPSDDELIEWMKADLASSDKAWNIVSIHHGPLNASTNYDKVLASALYELGIDLVLFGHDHVLLRSNPITFDDTGIVVGTSTQNAETGVHYAAAEGTVYYSSGCAGGSTYTQKSHPYFEVYDNPYVDSTYGAITVTEDTLTIRSHSVPNEHPDAGYILLDTFVMTKPAAACAEPPVAQQLTYNGEAQELITAGTTAEGKMLYSLDEENYSETIPSAMDQGTYTVWYKVAGDKDHSDSEVQSISVKIDPKDITGAIITLGDALTYNGSEQTQTIKSVISDGLDVTYTVSGNTAIEAGKEYTMVITGTGNFSGTASVTWSISEPKQEETPELEPDDDNAVTEETPATEETTVTEEATTEVVVSTEAPLTGDDSNLAIWVMLAGITLVLQVVLQYAGRRKV